MLTQERPRVVIVGAGFGGLFTARRFMDKPVDVVLIDRNNYHTFTPLIYQVATCGLDIEDVAYPVRSIFSESENIHFLLGEVVDVQATKKQVMVRDSNDALRPVRYDFLIIAAGSVTNTFGNANIAEHAFGLKTLSDAVNLRAHLLKQFEQANWESDPAMREELTTIVVVGGGPTGIETAGAVHELYEHVLRDEYHGLRDVNARVVLVEASDALLRPYPSKLQEAAKAQLEAIGVEVITGIGVQDVQADHVILSDGTEIRTRTLVWSAGVKGSPLAHHVGVELARGDRLSVHDTMEVQGLSCVYAVGDIASLLDENGRPYPQVIPVAQQQAALAAQNIVARVENRPQGHFTYTDKGSMATIGRRRAVVWLFNRFAMTGFSAWVAWLGLHLVTLMGFHNRVRVFVHWMYNYLTYDRAARVILEQRDLKTIVKPQAGNDADTGTDGKTHIA